MPPPFRRIALVWLLCGLALAGCRTAAVIAPTPTVTITFPAIDFGKRWLEIQTCRTACWEGVVPGLTSLSEAVDIAERHPLTDPRKTNTRDAKAGAREIWWNLGDQAQARVRIGHAVPAVADPGVVDSIVVKLDADSTISDVFSALGDPSHVEATAVMNLYLRQNMKSLSYIWAARGVAIEVANPGQATGFKPNDAADARYDASSSRQGLGITWLPNTGATMPDCLWFRLRYPIGTASRDSTSTAKWLMSNGEPSADEARHVSGCAWSSRESDCQTISV
jgi:hypothetical protein